VIIRPAIVLVDIVTSSESLEELSSPKAVRKEFTITHFDHERADVPAGIDCPFDKRQYRHENVSEDRQPGFRSTWSMSAPIPLGKSPEELNEES
jgi:hypothetical protein